MMTNTVGSLFQLKTEQLLYKVPHIELHDGNLAYWRDIKDAVFPLCSEPECTVVLTVIKHLLGEFSAVTADEDVQQHFAGVFNYVPLGAELFDLTALMKHLGTLNDLIKDYHLRDVDDIARKCSIYKLHSSLYKIKVANVDCSINGENKYSAKDFNKCEDCAGIGESFIGSVETMSSNSPSSQVSGNDQACIGTQPEQITEKYDIDTSGENDNLHLSISHHQNPSSESKSAGSLSKKHVKNKHDNRICHLVDKPKQQKLSDVSESTNISTVAQDEEDDKPSFVPMALVSALFPECSDKLRDLSRLWVEEYCKANFYDVRLRLCGKAEVQGFSLWMANMCLADILPHRFTTGTIMVSLTDIVREAHTTWKHKGSGELKKDSEDEQAVMGTSKSGIPTVNLTRESESEMKITNVAEGGHVEDAACKSPQCHQGEIVNVSDGVSPDDSHSCPQVGQIQVPSQVSVNEDSEDEDVIDEDEIDLPSCLDNSATDLEMELNLSHMSSLSLSDGENAASGVDLDITCKDGPEDKINHPLFKFGTPDSGIDAVPSDSDSDQVNSPQLNESTASAFLWNTLKSQMTHLHSTTENVLGQLENTISTGGQKSKREVKNKGYVSQACLRRRQKSCKEGRKDNNKQKWKKSYCPYAYNILNQEMSGYGNFSSDYDSDSELYIQSGSPCRNNQLPENGPSEGFLKVKRNLFGGYISDGGPNKKQQGEAEHLGLRSSSPQSDADAGSSMVIRSGKSCQSGCVCNTKKEAFQVSALENSACNCQSGQYSETVSKSGRYISGVDNAALRYQQMQASYNRVWSNVYTGSSCLDLNPWLPDGSSSFKTCPTKAGYKTDAKSKMFGVTRHNKTWRSNQENILLPSEDPTYMKYHPGSTGGTTDKPKREPHVHRKHRPSVSLHKRAVLNAAILAERNRTILKAQMLQVE